MIQAVMLVILGFLLASLFGLLIAPSLWNRAARLTRRRIEATLPMTLNEIEAAQDRVRGLYAVRIRRLESALSRAKERAALQLVDNSRLQMQLNEMRDALHNLQTQLDERRNAAAVFEQTIRKRFPELEREAANLREQLAARTVELQDLANRLKRKDESLELAHRRALVFEEEINQLREAMEKRSADRSGRLLRRPSQWNIDDYRAEYDRLNLELSKLRQQLAFLQERDSHQVALVKNELQKLSEIILSATEQGTGGRAAPLAVESPVSATPILPRPSESIPSRPAAWMPAAAARIEPRTRPEASIGATIPAQKPDQSQPSPLAAARNAASPAASATASSAASASNASAAVTSSTPAASATTASSAATAKPTDAVSITPKPAAQPRKPSLFESIVKKASDAAAGVTETAKAGLDEVTARAPLILKEEPAAQPASPSAQSADSAEVAKEDGAVTPAPPVDLPLSESREDALAASVKEVPAGREEAAPASEERTETPAIIPADAPQETIAPLAAAGVEADSPKGEDEPSAPLMEARELRALSELISSLNGAQHGDAGTKPASTDRGKDEIAREARQGVIIDATAEPARQADEGDASAEKPAKRSLLDRLRSVPERAELEK